MKTLIVIVATCLVFYSDAKPAYNEWNEIEDFSRESKRDFSQEDGLGTTITDCHGISCPAGTVACSKTVKTSSDKRTLLTTVQCEDVQGNVLNSATKSAENPFENTQISSFSFTGHYHHTGGSSIGLTKPVYHNTGFGAGEPTYHNTYYNNNDEVETFQK